MLPYSQDNNAPRQHEDDGCDFPTNDQRFLNNNDRVLKSSGTTVQHQNNDGGNEGKRNLPSRSQNRASHQEDGTFLPLTQSLLTPPLQGSFDRIYECFSWQENRDPFSVGSESSTSDNGITAAGTTRQERDLFYFDPSERMYLSHSRNTRKEEHTPKCNDSVDPLKPHGDGSEPMPLASPTAQEASLFINL